jgi:hypothetical protein
MLTFYVLFPAIAGASSTVDPVKRSDRIFLGIDQRLITWIYPGETINLLNDKLDLTPVSIKPPRS